METIIVAIIVGGFSLVGTITSNLFTYSKTIYRIEQLEKKQDKHNSLMERTFKLESKVCVLAEKQCADHEEIENLRK